MTSTDPQCFTVAELKLNLYLAAYGSNEVVKFCVESESYTTLPYTLAHKDRHHRIFGVGEHLFIIDSYGTYEIDEHGNLLKSHPAKTNVGSWHFGTPTY
jgi:hypothetical protein